jgi:gas vesicle protein
MESILSFFRDLSEKNNELFTSVTTGGEPDSQKLRTFLIKNKIDCKGSNMFSLAKALSDSLTDTSKVASGEHEEKVVASRESEVIESRECEKEKERESYAHKEESIKKVFSTKDFDPATVQSLSFEFEVLHGVYKVGRPDESRQKALEDAHIKCDQALDWIVEIKNTTDNFASVIGGITYAADTPSLANSLFELYLQLNQN